MGRNGALDRALAFRRLSRSLWIYAHTHLGGLSAYLCVSTIRKLLTCLSLHTFSIATGVAVWITISVEPLNYTKRSGNVSQICLSVRPSVRYSTLNDVMIILLCLDAGSRAMAIWVVCFALPISCLFVTSLTTSRAVATSYSCLLAITWLSLSLAVLPALHRLCG